MVKELVIWAHSECRSNAALFECVKRLAEARGIAVTMCLWDESGMSEERKEHRWDAIKVGEDVERGRKVLGAHGGEWCVHVFCVYQNSPAWRTLIVEAKKGGARVVVNAEAPCEMCVGVKALLKRMYYRWVLPRRVREAVEAADLFLSASGVMGVERLERLGWRREQIVPFGYASPPLFGRGTRPRVTAQLESNTSISGRVERPARPQSHINDSALGSDCGQAGTLAPTVSGDSCLVMSGRAGRSTLPRLRVLHLGSEERYRGIGVAERAVAMVEGAELVKTGGRLSVDELVDELHKADVVVACGLCEPWGMRVNDALMEGVPVVVSDGMGAAMLCDEYGCGCVVPKGDANALARVLRRCAEDRAFLERLRSGAKKAAEELQPEKRAEFWLEKVVGG